MLVEVRRSKKNKKGNKVFEGNHRFLVIGRIFLSFRPQIKIQTIDKDDFFVNSCYKFFNYEAKGLAKSKAKATTNP